MMKGFLMAQATRHTVFNYELIAVLRSSRQRYKRLNGAVRVYIIDYMRSEKKKCDSQNTKEH